MSNQIYRNNTQKYGRLLYKFVLNWTTGATGTNNVLLEKSRKEPNVIRVTINEFTGVSTTNLLRTLSLLPVEFRPSTTQYFTATINLSGSILNSHGAIETTGNIYIRGPWTNPTSQTNYKVTFEYKLN